MRKSWLSFVIVILVCNCFWFGGNREDSRPIKAVASYHDPLVNLFDNSSTWFDESDGLWKPAGGDRAHLARVLLTDGGYVEFSLPVSGVYFHFDKSDYRSAESFIRRRQPGQTSADYLDTGFEFVYSRDPGPDSTFGFGHSFTPPIVALLIEGPCLLEDIVYHGGVRP